jgi:hypothetical protein
MVESQPQAQPEEVIEPGKPLRPDPGAPQTRGGTMDDKEPLGQGTSTPK